MVYVVPKRVGTTQWMVGDSWWWMVNRGGWVVEAVGWLRLMPGGCREGRRRYGEEVGGWLLSCLVWGRVQGS